MLRSVARMLPVGIMALGAGGASAQNYPQNPIRLLVPSAAGSGMDFIVRLVSAKVSESVGKSIVVDNRGGANGAIALEIAARANADGYTLSAVSASHVINSILHKTSYDLYRDLAPVSQMAAAPYVLVVHPALPVNSVGELVAYAKAHPGKLNFASSGTASMSQLAMELVSINTGIKLVHIPYKGVGATFPDLLSGRTPVNMASLPSHVPHIRNKTLRALAVTSAQRMTMLAEVPTMIEAGIPGYVVTQWHGLLAPAATPRPVIERLHREIVKALEQSGVTERLANEGVMKVGSTPAQLAAHMKEEHATWSRVIRQAGIREQ